MNAPLPLAYWEGIRRIADPFELMKFTLIYDGHLPSAGNKVKSYPASEIRNVFHDQLADLWDGHAVMRGLARTARVHSEGLRDLALTKGVPIQPEYKEPIPPVPHGYVDLCASILVPNVGGFIPLIRHSLNLSCAIDILFLRHEEPFSLMKQGGDLDGRLKTLFDGLRMPDPNNIYIGADPIDDPLYVVLEDDALISDFSVRSGKLLGRDAKYKHAVRLQVDVTIKVMRVTEENQCLIGG